MRLKERKPWRRVSVRSVEIQSSNPALGVRSLPGISAPAADTCIAPHVAGVGVHAAVARLLSGKAREPLAANHRLQSDATLGEPRVAPLRRIAVRRQSGAMRSDLNLECRDSLRSEARHLSKAVLSGELDILEAAPRLWAVLQRLGLDWDDEDSSAFGLIASETEHLPVGQQRLHWSEQALERKEPRVVEARKWAEEFGMPACQRVASRWGS